MPFISAGDGDLKKVFITDTWLIDQYVGDRLWLTGDNTYGQIGDNTVTSKTTLTETVSGNVTWVSVATGYHSLAIKNDGSLWTWGRNTYGQLGDNTTTHRSSPIQTVASGNDWKQVGTTQFTSFAIKKDNTLWGWGRNNLGQLGDNTAVNKSSPVQTITYGDNWQQISCGNEHVGAIKFDGTLWLWGQGTSGQLGDNTILSKSSPIQTVTFGTNWKQISCGTSHCAAIKTNGTLWCWGTNANGELGDNTSVSKSSPVQTVTFGGDWKQVACARQFTAAVKTDGTLWIWGSNSYGNLGDNTVTRKSSPVQTVAYGSNWKSVSCGYNTIGAIKTDSSMWVWGQGGYGSIGNSSLSNRSSPVQTTLGGKNWKMMYVGKTLTGAITNGN